MSDTSSSWSLVSNPDDDTMNGPKSSLEDYYVVAPSHPSSDDDTSLDQEQVLAHSLASGGDDPFDHEQIIDSESPSDLEQPITAQYPSKYEQTSDAVSDVNQGSVAELSSFMGRTNVDDSSLLDDSEILVFSASAGSMDLGQAGVPIQYTLPSVQISSEQPESVAVAVMDESVPKHTHMPAADDGTVPPTPETSSSASSVAGIMTPQTIDDDLVANDIDTNTNFGPPNHPAIVHQHPSEHLTVVEENPFPNDSTNLDEQGAVPVPFEEASSADCSGNLTASVSNMVNEWLTGKSASDVGPSSEVEELDEEVKSVKAPKSIIQDSASPASKNKDKLSSTAHQVFDGVRLWTISQYVLIFGQICEKSGPFSDFLLGDSAEMWVQRVASSEIGHPRFHRYRPAETLISDSVKGIFNNYGIIGLLYVMLRCHVYGVHMTERNAKRLARIQNEAEKYLVPKSNYFVRVTGSTMKIIADLEVKMKRAKRQATFKNNEFYFGLKDGEFVFLDHDAAMELKQDLLDHHIKAIVQQDPKT
ncbi:hypothetical protein V8E51_019300 [Hyaloscypha variabilis]